MKKDDEIFETIGVEKGASSSCYHDVLKRHFQPSELNFHYAFSEKKDVEIMGAAQARHNAERAFNEEMDAIKKELSLMILTESNLGRYEISYSVQNKEMTVQVIKRVIDELLNLGYIVSDSQFELTNTIKLEVKW